MSDAPRWTVEGRAWPLAQHSRFVDAAGLRWHVQRLGSGPPLLLIHGTGAATHSWRGLAPLLAARCEVIAIDLPGHGFTRGGLPGGTTLPAVASAVAALLKRLDVTPRVLIGHSAGAAIAIRLVQDGFRPDGIVGLSPALQPFPGVAARLFPSLARLLFVNPFVPMMLAGIARVPGEVDRFLRRSTGSHLDATGVDCYALLFGRPGHVAGAIGMMAGWDLEPIAASLPRLETPLLLIHGSADPAIPLASARRSAAAAKNGRLHVLTALGHLAHEERPDLVADLINDFVSAKEVLPA